MSGSSTFGRSLVASGLRMSFGFLPLPPTCGTRYLPLMPIFYDTHAHLGRPEFAADLPQVIARAAAAGIAKIVTIGTDLASSARAVKLAEQYPNLFAAVGWHPSHAARSARRFAARAARTGAASQGRRSRRDGIGLLPPAEPASPGSPPPMTSATKRSRPGCSASTWRWPPNWGSTA